MSLLNESHKAKKMLAKVVLHKLVQRSIKPSPKQDLLTTKANKAQTNYYKCLESKH